MAEGVLHVLTGYWRRSAWLVCMAAVCLPVVALAAEERAPTADGPLRVVAFYSSTCRNCEKAKSALRRSRARFGDRVEIIHRDVKDVDLFAEMFRYEDHYGGQAQSPPKVYVGEQYLEGYPAIGSRLVAVIGEELAKGSVTYVPPAETATSDEDDVPDVVLERFRQFGPAAVALAGLLDGVNPCAFTTIVFLLSMLAYLGKGRRELAVVGVGFTAAVFGTYLTLGLSAFWLLEAVKAFSVGSGVATGLTVGVGVFTLALAGWSLVDYARYVRGGRDAKKMTLGLPRGLRLRVNRVIRRGLGTRGLLVGSVTVGAVVALLESLCTGQVYLPTIVFVSRVPEMRPAAWSYLVLYNVMFIVPLVAVLAVAYLGVGSQRLGELLRRNLGALKLAMAALFMLLGVLVLMTA
ncbi:MAG: cytochrome c biogenesis protein [Planctomycetota bacterium]